MRLLEHAALELIALTGLNVAPYREADSPEATAEVARALGGTVVVKALIPAGRRGKEGAGG
ncbi:MAG: acetate--CoA ligase family protein [Candidatus Rokubacteria bacterium]|nr:acetate--CoA ligase family protein [Candidatus Rokubacteria bacterium]